MDTAMEENNVYSNPDSLILNTEVDVDQLCRVCANPNEYLIPIFRDEGLEHDLKNKISKHLPIKIAESDKLPVQLCYQCASTLIAWHDLVIGCLEADEKLRSFILDDESGNYETNIEKSQEKEKEGYLSIQLSTVERNDNIVSEQIHKKPNLTRQVSLDSLLETEQVAEDKFRPLEPEFSDATSDSRDETKLKCEENPKTIPWEIVESTEVIPLEIKEDPEATAETYSEDVASAVEFYEDVETYQDVETSVVVHEFIEGFEEGGYITFVSDDFVQNSVEVINQETEETEESEDDCNQYICEDCGKVFSSMNAYRTHISVHQKGGHCCKLCKAVYRRIDHLEKHMEIMHPNFILPPKEKKINPYAKTFLCNLCGRILKSSIAYENHTLRHQSKNPFPCSICTERFPNKGARRKHEVKEHNLLFKDNGNPDGYHVCEICGLEMFSDGAYYHHKDKHGDPYPCTFCGKLYGSRSLMQVHARRHTSERPFSCSLCNRNFKVKQELNAHMNVHRDLRPYQCPHCPKMCRKSSDLTHHIRTHTGEKPFICDKCGRGFAQAGDMRKHRMLHFRPSKINKSASL